LFGDIEVMIVIIGMGFGEFVWNVKWVSEMMVIGNGDRVRRSRFCFGFCG
jgi:hypothetical protein